jgi:glycerophosphoryl diester phosphodiesterase
MQADREPTASQFWVIGHRGSPTHEPENTLRSFERALADGANGIELDLCVTADGQVVVWHDADPDESRARFRQLGLEPVVRYRPKVPSQARFRRPVHQLTLAELRTHFGYVAGPFGEPTADHIPDLDELMAWASPQSRLGVVFLDIKVGGEREDLLRLLLHRVDELVARHRPRFRIVLETADPRAAASLARLGPNYGHALDVEPDAGIVLDFERFSAARAAIAQRLSHATAQRPRSITLFPFATHRKIVEADLALLRRHNQECPAVPLQGLCAFTINDAAEMQSLVELGVWGIQSDRPGLLREVALACGRRVDPP